MANPNDPFDSVNAQSLLDPPDDIYPITPSNTDTLSPACRSLRAAGAGNIQVTMRNGEVRVLAFAAGETRYGRFAQVWSTNTTATGIEGGV